LNVREGGTTKLMMKSNKVITKPIPNPFELALKYPKFAKTRFEEFEKESEEIQRELFEE